MDRITASASAPGSPAAGIDGLDGSESEGEPAALGKRLDAEHVGTRHRTRENELKPHLAGPDDDESVAFCDPRLVTNRVQTIGQRLHEDRALERQLLGELERTI